MNLFPSHQRNTNRSLFGLLASRFLFNEGPHKQPYGAVEKKEADLERGRQEYLEGLRSDIAAYNGRWGDEREEDNEGGVHYESLGLDPANLNGTKEQIDSIIRALKKEHESFPETLANNDQFITLEQMIGIIEEIQKLPQANRDAVQQERRSRLSKRHERMSKATEEKKAWAKKPAYKEINSVFDNLMNSDDFKDIWKSPDGLVSQNQREGRELFLAIIAEKTNGFETDFVLGDDFGNNADENIRNFPFLYNEFLKHEGDMIAGEGVSVEALKKAESDAEEAKKKLQQVRPAEVIAASFTSGGPNPAELAAMPAMPDNDGWKERVRVLNSWAYRLRDSASKEGFPQKNTYISGADQIEMHLQHAKANLRLSQLKTSEQGVQVKFTRAELSQPSRRRTMMELAMKKFIKAQEIVDHPYGASSDWRYSLHPTVRRMLVASTYDEGVADYDIAPDGTKTYIDKAQDNHRWMLASLVQTDYFNFKERGEEMDENHKALLKAAYLGGRVATQLEQTKDIKGLLEAWQGVLESAAAGRVPPTGPERERFFRERMGAFPPQYVKQYAQYDLDQTKDALQAINDDRATLQGFLNEVKAALQDPYSQKSEDFIAKMKKPSDDPTGYGGKLGPAVGRLGRMGIIDGATLAAYNKQMFNLEVNFRTSELQEKNMLQFFEGMGLHIEGIYPKYLDMIAKNPKLKAEYWDRLLTGTDDEYKQLIGLFQVILNNDKAGGKKDFIAGLGSLRKKYKGKQLNEIEASLQEGTEDGAIINIFKMLQLHLSDRAITAASGDRGLKDIEARLGGVHIGDKVSKYVGGVWDMLTGPGQSMANRAAGLVLLYGFYKSARMAMKGEGKSGKMLRALFVAGAVEIAMKEVTGRGILDRAGLDAIAGAMEGTYEAVLLQDAEKNMDAKEITSEAHAAALFELNDVPFHKVMEWYESSDNNGMPKKQGAKDLFPGQIDLNKIGPKVTWDVKDKKVESRRVVWETVRHFFKYVGGKDNKRSLEHGKEALKERWIKMVDDPKYKPIYSSYDHREWFENHGVKKNDINWQMVMRSEIDPSEVDLTRNKTMTGQLTTKALEVAHDLSEWTREHVYNPGSGYAEEFVNGMGEKGQEAKKLADDIYAETKQKAYFGKESVILWYGKHQYEIRRSLEGHWDLLVTGLGIPFKVVYAVDNWAIPWTLKNVKLIEESLRPDKPFERQDALDSTYIANSRAALLSRDREINPQFKIFGIEQESFLNAFENKNEPMSYENNDMHLGYYISTATAKEAGANPNDSPEDIKAKMEIKSRAKAREHFFKKGMSYTQIDAHMYSMHQMTKTGEPQTVYTFYRMPLQGSVELHLMEIGRFADYKDPNRRNDRQPFIIDPNQTSWENLQRGLALEMDVTRTIASGVGGYAAQVPRVIFAHIEWAGKLVKAIGTSIGGDKEFQAAIDAISVRPPSTRMFIDEFFTSAKSEHMALSDFYRDSLNAKLYRFSLEYAQNKHHSLHLGLLEGRPGRDSADYNGSIYLKGSLDYNDMLHFYEDNYKKNPDKQIEDAINEKIRAAATP